MNLILIGFKRAGKTTYGKQLAESLKVPFLDTDDLIKEAYQKKTSQKLKAYEIHQLLGDQAFRALEEKLVLKLNMVHFVISVGGGTLLSPINQKHLKTLGSIVYLRQSKEDVKRVLSLGRIPTFLDCNNFDASFDAMYQKRAPIFEELSDYTLDLENLKPEEVLKALIKWAKNGSIFS